MGTGAWWIGYSSSGIGPVVSDTASVPSVGAGEQLVQARPVHHVVVDVIGDLVLAEMDHAALYPGHDDRMPHRRVRQVEVHVAQLVPAELGVEPLDLRAAQEVRESRQIGRASCRERV